MKRHFLVMTKQSAGDHCMFSDRSSSGVAVAMKAVTIGNDNRNYDNSNYDSNSSTAISMTMKANDSTKCAFVVHGMLQMPSQWEGKNMPQITFCWRSQSNWLLFHQIKGHFLWKEEKGKKDLRAIRCLHLQLLRHLLLFNPNKAIGTVQKEQFAWSQMKRIRATAIRISLSKYLK